VVVGVDTSGSVGPKELNMFMAEISGILADVQPKRLIIMWCDANIGRVDECEDENDLNTLRCKGVPGGGGTSFVPVFEEIEKMNITPDALVYLTDGMGTFPRTAPKYPVIWGNIYPASKYPFGDVVDIPKQAA
jgi:predicted metal-dependent peptidase